MLETPQRTDSWHAPPPAEALPRISVFDAVRKYKVLALMPLVLLLVAALAFSLLRSPDYTAEARLTVASIDLNTPGAINGYESVTQALASAYSRAITADDVITPLSRQFGLSPGQLRRQLDANPLPESPVVRVDATAEDPDRAVRLANAASTALIGYVAELNSSPEALDRAYEAYRRTAETTEQREIAISQLASRVERDGSGASESDQAKLARLRTFQRLSTLRLNALRTEYQRLQSARGSTGGLELLVRATAASSDSSSFLQLALYGAVALGLVLGAALALLRARSVMLRQHTATL